MRSPARPGPGGRAVARESARIRTLGCQDHAQCAGRLAVSWLVSKNMQNLRCCAGIKAANGLVASQKRKPTGRLARRKNRKDAALALATWVLTPVATAGCSSAGGAPTARRRPPNARCRGGGVLSRPGRRPSRPIGPRANPILQESHWTSQWPEWSASPGGHGESKAEDSLSGAGRFRKALQPGHCPLDRERTAARSNSSG